MALQQLQGSRDLSSQQHAGQRGARSVLTVEYQRFIRGQAGGPCTPEGQVARAGDVPGAVFECAADVDDPGRILSLQRFVKRGGADSGIPAAVIHDAFVINLYKTGR